MRESITCHSLSRQVCWLAFETSGIEPIPLAFEASVRLIALLVLQHHSRLTNMDGNLYDNKSFISWQARHIRSPIINHSFLDTQTPKLCNMSLNEDRRRMLLLQGAARCRAFCSCAVLLADRIGSCDLSSATPATQTSAPYSCAWMSSPPSRRPPNVHTIIFAYSSSPAVDSLLRHPVSQRYS